MTSTLSIVMGCGGLSLAGIPVLVLCFSLRLLGWCRVALECEERSSVT